MMTGRANEWKKRMQESLSSSSEDDDDYTSVGTPTITSTLKDAEMPNVLFYNDIFNHVSSEEDETSTSRTYQRQVAGLDRADSPDNVIVSLSDNRTDGKQQQREEYCCTHGNPCAVGRAMADRSKRGKRNAVAEYESVNIDDKLESPPPTSVVSSKSDRSRSSKKYKKPVIYRCHYPTGLSSIDTPSSYSNDGVYENINTLDNRSKASNSSFSFATACDASVTGHQPFEGHRRYRPSGTNLEDFYLGGMRKRDAEKRIKRNTHFGLYHRVPSNAAADINCLKDNISLYIVYKTSKGEYFHYPIQRARVDPSFGTKTTKQYFINCDDYEPVRFNSLDALIRYYTVYVQFVVGEGVEIFPPPPKTRHSEVCEVYKPNKHGKCGKSAREMY